MFNPTEKSNQMLFGEAESHDHHDRDIFQNLCFPMVSYKHVKIICKVQAAIEASYHY